MSTREMVPITYYPIGMQRQFAANRAALVGSEYEKYFAETLTVPLDAVLGIQRGPMAIADTLPPSVEGIGRFLAGNIPAANSGYAILEGPTLHVQSRIAFPGSSPDMFRWWFWWHALDARRYKLWFPHSHIDARAADRARLADASLTFEKRFYDNPQHVVEYMGPDLFESVVRFTAPAKLGFNMDQFHAAGFEASASGLLELPGHPDITVGMMIHIVRPVAGGMELFNRYWLGGHPALKGFPGAENAAALLAAAGMNAAQMERVAYELAIHDMTEWNNLARILPPLYAEFGS